MTVIDAHTHTHTVTNTEKIRIYILLNRHTSSMSNTYSVQKCGMKLAMDGIWYVQSTTESTGDKVIKESTNKSRFTHICTCSFHIENALKVRELNDQIHIRSRKHGGLIHISPAPIPASHLKWKPTIQIMIMWSYISYYIVSISVSKRPVLSPSFYLPPSPLLMSCFTFILYFSATALILYCQFSLAISRLEFVYHEIIKYTSAVRWWNMEM